MSKAATAGSVEHTDTTQNKVCPKCGGAHVHRSRRRNLERWLSWLHTGQRVYRCYDCQHRFWEYKQALPSRRMPDASQASDALAGDAKVKKRKKRKRSDGITPYHRFREWLYRKHSLTIGTLVLFILFISLSLFLIVVGLDHLP